MWAWAWTKHEIELNVVTRAASRQLLQLFAKRDPSMDQARQWATLLVAKYKPAAAASAYTAIMNSRLALDVWHDLQRPVLADYVNADQIAGSVAWAFHGKEDDPQAALRALRAPLQRHILAGARQTIFDSTAAAKTAWARVPGPKACHFCLMLASRGGVYSSYEKGLNKAAGGRFHDRCTCRVVETVTAADIPKINHDLHDEWQTLADETKLSGKELEDRWKEYVKATRPLGFTTREVLENGTVRIYPKGHLIGVGNLKNHHQFNPKKPTAGIHSEQAVNKLIEAKASDPNGSYKESTTFLSGSDDTKFTSIFTEELAVSITNKPDCVAKGLHGYQYWKDIQLQPGDTEKTRVVVALGPVGRKNKHKLPGKNWQINSIFPDSGPNIMSYDVVDGIKTVPYGKGKIRVSKEE